LFLTFFVQVPDRTSAALSTFRNPALGQQQADNGLVDMVEQPPLKRQKHENMNGNSSAGQDDCRSKDLMEEVTYLASILASTLEP
jgi:hypothetical protein